MRTHIHLGPVTALMLASLVLSASAAGDDDIAPWAMAMGDVFTDAYNARDTEALKQYFAPDAEVNGARGIDAVLDYLKGEWAEDDTVCEDDIRAMKVINDHALLWGVSACWPRTGKRSDAERLDWFAHWKRQSDGAWRSVFEQW